ncbi:MAG: glycosyltransferase family 2 protein [Nanoarchaeota archaeon]|nr:glycosyltransferase family 2 protein [Nanoarchaeota archaeon]
MKIFIVVAAYNEEKRIEKVISDLKSHNYKNIVIVDDCSKDNTYSIAKKQKVHLIKHKINQGQGATLRTGINFALKNGADIVITFDGDGQHLASEIPKIIKPLKKGYDIVIGSRFIDKKVKTKMPLKRKIELKGSVIILRIFYGLKVTDAHNGFRALSKKAAKKIKITCNRMAHASEIIYEIKRNKLKFKEIPVKIIYTKETLMKSDSGIKQGFRILKDMIKLKLRK